MNGAPVFGSIGDGFTLAAVGDCLVAQPVSQTRRFAPIGELISGADVAFGNLESCLVNPSLLTVAPQAEFGCAWAMGSPAVASDLKNIGFDLVSRANNHAIDFGLDGMRQTSRALDEVGIIHSGAGEDRAAARAPRYLDTGKGRVALISVASTFAPLSRAAPPCGKAPGRPGVNALRTTPYLLVTQDELRMLWNIRNEQPAGSVSMPEQDPPDEVELCGVRYKVASRRGFTYSVDSVDEREILESVREAKRMAHFVIVTIHAHEPGNWSEQPADCLPNFAHRVIDAGADAFIGHGPHRIRGIEVYRGRPVFYSLGNFIFQLESPEPVLHDLFEQYRMDLGASGAELNALWIALSFGGDTWYQSVVTTTRFEKGRTAEIRLTPVELRRTARPAERGLPRLATRAVAGAILERLQNLSEPFGTRISIEKSIGVIREPARSYAAAEAMPNEDCNARLADVDHPQSRTRR